MFLRNIIWALVFFSLSGFAQINLNIEKPDLPADAWELKQFKRSKEYAAKRETHGITNADWARWQEWQRLQKDNTNKISAAGTWSNFGPHKISGRIISIAFHPTDTNIIYAGAAGGGLWKSINYGKNWTPLTDFLPSLAIGAIAINPKNPNKILIATGEGYSLGSEFTYGCGVLVSKDAGQTFSTTVITTSLSQGFSGMDIIWSRKDTNKVCIATSFGVYFSNDGGVSYTYVLNRMPARMIADPKRPDTLYLAARYYNSTFPGGLYRSFNAGQSWTLTGTGLPIPNDFGYASLTVHPVYTNMLFANISKSSPNGLGPMHGLYKSINYGVSWTQIPTNVDLHCYPVPSQTICQGWFANTILVSPSDTNTLFAGGTRFWKSVNGGSVWKLSDTTATGTAAIHADHHQTLYHPLSGHLFDCNDGGINYTKDGGGNWTSLSDGLITHQFYKVAFAETNPNLVIGGTQDVGFFTSNMPQSLTSWTNTFNGDAFGCAIDYTNANIWYAHGFMTYLRIKTVNAGLNWAFINSGTSSADQWRMPITMHPSNPQTLLTSDYFNMYKTVNGGTSWTVSHSAGDVGAYAFDKINPNIVYASQRNASLVYRSGDGASSWTALSASPGATITNLATDPSQINVVYATIGTYTNSRVLKSINAGNNWIDITNNLPKVPANCVVVDPFDSQIIYVGTDLGVWVTQDGGTTWSDFNNSSLPYVVVEDIHYYKPDSTIRVGTYGRGYWKVKALPTTFANIKKHEQSKIELFVYPNPSSHSDNITLKIISRANENAKVKITNSIGQVLSLQTIKLTVGSNEINVVRAQSAGVYFISVTVGKETKNIKFIITD